MARIRKASAAATIILLFMVTFGFTLEVSPSSPCAPKCIDDPSKETSDPASSLTVSRDLFCYDWEIEGDNKTQNGIRFKDCQNCIKSSGYAWGTAMERDTSWFLYNNRAVVDWCLFGRLAEEENKDIAESSIYKSCNAKCNDLYSATNGTLKNNTNSFSYCDQPGNFTSTAEPCMACLYGTPGLTILGNVVATIVDMCKQKPGNSYSFPRDQEIYAATKVNLSGTSPASDTTDNPSPSNTALRSGSNGLATGALAGIVLGGLLGVAVILAGMLFILRRVRKSKGVIAGKSDIKGETPDAEIGNYQYGNAGRAQR